ncbi:uncharacterized protein LOC131300038 isoform X2 [Rhododendron vialii]|uniref:uncharacterized protein LOC131300038 isoform X2 n=1 Tax=Rhododendron vialii TaxID=182163 RepID=UPI00265EBF8A|nr:uncharacterized protein LOC131300038 isoform X2 [Rhododendron vialii]XP_058181658.1 uncharacterized protein LOC131300038 isoform X2 [Rhododendron vialii]
MKGMEGKGPYSFLCFNRFPVVSGHPIAACVHAVFICHIHSEDVTALQVQADLCKNLRSVGLDVDHFTFPEGIPGVLETSFSKYSHQHALIYHRVEEVLEESDKSKRFKRQ